MARSPLAQRRWLLFRHNKRGFWSCILFLVLFLVSLCAEMIANDKPILLSYDGKLHFPMVESYPETHFGGEFKTEAVYTDPYVQKLIHAKGWMLMPPIHYRYDTIDFASVTPAPSAPSEAHLLGTDDQGRDVLTRILYGFRLSVLFGLILTAISSTIGILAGAIQGYYGGWIDMILQRIIEVLSSIPFLVLLITIASMIRPGFWTLMAIMVLVTWTYLVDVVRAECLKTRNMDYVRAARALGVKELRILLRHVLPNAFVSGLTLMPIVLGLAITSLTALDFLGFGLPPEAPSLGELLKQGKDNISAHWLLFSSVGVLTVMMALLVFIGEAVRDALDPRKSQL